MTDAAHGTLVAATACALLSCGLAAASGAERPAPVVVVAPEQALAKYERALQYTVTPGVMRFEYAVEQVGPHNLTQTHRVYRSGLNERDEILSVDGQFLPTPAIRIIRDRVNHYGIGNVAPRPRDYVFSFVGMHRDGALVDYVFSTAPRDPLSTPYQVVGVAIEGAHFLPRTISYQTASGAARGHGTLTFWRQDKYWVIAQATATARIRGKVARERLVFHNYDFPTSLPESTFTEPRAVPSSPP